MVGRMANQVIFVMLLLAAYAFRINECPAPEADGAPLPCWPANSVWPPGWARQRGSGGHHYPPLALGVCGRWVLVLFVEVAAGGFFEGMLNVIKHFLWRWTEACRLSCSASAVMILVLLCGTCSCIAGYH